ncbi:MAG TPA: ribonuclease H-like domain-containing protein [Vicinamibacterales bacterium]|nr:ribonuclease H-like domain-containing protein [Vicinamibacterales bacterium]
MRDLTSRLREIVRRDGGASRVPVDPPRELTYVPDVLEPVDRSSGDDDVHGRPAGDDEACVVIEERYAADRSHGRRAIDAYAPVPDAPLHLFDPSLASSADWARRVVFFDIETTGLSGGAGTIAFLAGCGWFEPDGFVVRQFFLASPSGEKAMLAALASVFREASLLVTYNGRTFDVPFMETRWAFHRERVPTDDVPHFDLLPSARRLWRRRETAADAGCSLSTLEGAVLDFHRVGDVPGFEIPARYFQFLRSGDRTVVDGVLEHNRHDLVSLAALMSHALWLAREGPMACRESSERLALGRLYERAGQTDVAAEAYDLAARTDDLSMRCDALAHLAVLHRRARRFDEAAVCWQAVLDTAGRRRGPLAGMAQRAAEALAIHHEHRSKDVATARRYAEVLRRGADGRGERDAVHRLDRLNRKIERSTGQLSWETGN